MSSKVKGCGSLGRVAQFGNVRPMRFRPSCITLIRLEHPHGGDEVEPFYRRRGVGASINP